LLLLLLPRGFISVIASSNYKSCRALCFEMNKAYLINLYVCGTDGLYYDFRSGGCIDVQLGENNASLKNVVLFEVMLD
jgi:hypothetical protein